jgi:pyruvate dehydrogenase E2 component (dihydrolipoamide acetyltransferase)
MSEILMPALSPTMEQGTLAKWFVAVGDTVRPGDVIAEIETDKATMEVEASEEGVIAELLVPAGTEEVPVQTPIARFSAEAGSAARGTSASAVSPSPAPKPSAPEAGPRLSPSVRRIVTEERLDPTQIRGSGREGRLLKADALEAAASRQPVALDATPLARKLAQAAGIDLSARDNRPGNRLRKADLVRPREIEPAHPSPSQGEGASPPRVASRAPAIDGAYDLIPLDGMRRTIAERMTDSFRDIPHFPLTIDLEIDAVLDVRNQVNAALAPDGFKVSINVLHHHGDISVAVAIDGGLITPIIRAAETKGLAAISREMLDLAERARSRRLKPEEYQGGTFSISNLGMFGIKSFSSIINAPQGAILSIGAAEPRPVVRDDTVTIARVMTCTLTCDHRAMDGVAGARLLSAVRQMVTEPIRLMA